MVYVLHMLLKCSRVDVSSAFPHPLLFNDIEKLSFQDAFILIVECCTLTKAKSVDHLMLL